MGCADGALALHDHKNMIIVLVVVHVILKVRLTIDHPEISQIGAPEAEMIDFRVGVGFFDGIFHFDHGVPPLYYLLFNRFAPFKRFKRFERLERLERFLFSISWRPFFGLDQASMSAVAIGMILGSPTAADSDGRRLVEFQDVRSDVRNYI